MNAVAGPTSVPGTTIGTVQQFFTLTLAANAGEQAVRTEVLSFSVSLKELKDWREGRGLEACDRPRRQELLGNLGIKEWIDAAIAPVENGILQAGKHPAPNAGSKPSAPAIVSKPAAIPSLAAALVLYQALPFDMKAKVDLPPEIKDKISQNADLTQKQGEQVVQSVGKVVPMTQGSAPTAQVVTKALLDADAALVGVNADRETVKELIADLETKKQSAMQARASYGPVSTSETILRLDAVRTRIRRDLSMANAVRGCIVQQRCGEAYGDCSAFKNLDGQKGKESKSAMECHETDAKCAMALDGGVTGVINERTCVEQARPDAENAARLAQSYAATSRALTGFLQKYVADAVIETPDPPVDGLGHSIQFVVAYGASVTPSWTLINVKLPGLNAPAASVSANRTHLLQLALGPTTAVVATEQDRIITNQNLLNR